MSFSVRGNSPLLSNVKRVNNAARRFVEILLVIGTEALVQRCSKKKIFIKIMQCLQENLGVGVSF